MVNEERGFLAADSERGFLDFYYTLASHPGVRRGSKEGCKHLDLDMEFTFFARILATDLLHRIP